MGPVYWSLRRVPGPLAGHLVAGDAGRRAFAEYLSNLRRALNLPAGGYAGGGGAAPYRVGVSVRRVCNRLE